jgi:hypothetical protein
MGQELSQVTTQHILEKIRQLEPQQIAEVMDFIDFLAERKSKGFALVQLLREAPGAGIGLEEVRKRLAKIQGKMSETVRELRDERG